MQPIPTISGVSPKVALPPEHLEMMEKAKELEAAFLSEMLAYTGLDAQSDSFGGGVGEDQFASFLRGEQARLMVDKGGIGLAETIFKSLVKTEGGADAA